MARAVESEIIFAPRERVFEYRLDLYNLPAYNPDVVEVRSDGGSAYAFRLRIVPGFWWPTRLQVTEAERPDRIRFAIDSLFNAKETCTFESKGPGNATRIVFETEVESRGGPLAPLIDATFVLPILKWQLRRELKLMKQNLEKS